MSNNTSAAKREELLKKKEHWFAQRLAAQEREKLAAENDLALLSLNETPGTNSDLTRNANPNKSDCVHESNSQSLVSRNAPYPGDEQVLDRITERITNRLREEVRSEILRDVEEESRKRGTQFQKLEGFLAAELEQATCPICFELMVPPVHTPILIFPCGHTFCTTCLAAHCKANRNNCPYCRKQIQSQAPNMMMQQLIEGFANKRAIEKKSEAAGAGRLATGEQKSGGADQPRTVLPSALEGCEGDAREEVERYVREWRSVSMRWRIYDNEAGECQREMDVLRSRREAARLVREHLATEMADAERRLREAQAEVELIQAQLDQQRQRDEQAEAEAAEKSRRHQLLVATKDGLDAERARIRLLVRHYLPPTADVDAVLDGQI